jgi:hypothetical protein
MKMLYNTTQTFKNFKLISFFILFLSLSCTFSDSSRRKVEPSSTDLYWRELSLFLSGLPLDTSNRFYHLTNSTNYRSYAKSIQINWQKIESDYLTRVRPFQREHLPEIRKGNTSMYPFSGADFVNLYAFFPDSDYYTMIALEPPGKITDPNTLTADQLRLGLNSLQNTMQQMAEQNYFTRRKMRSEFANPYFSGVSALLIIFMTRFGLFIDHWEKVELNDQGKLVLANTTTNVNSIQNPSERIEGIRIYFHKPEDKSSRELAFVKLKLNENSSEENTIQGKFFAQPQGYNLILKSAEYILQLPKYERFNQSILARTQSIVQDDSGIPYRALNKSEWNVELFGFYSGRAKLQNTPNVADQNDLKQDYQSSVPVLPFNYGYGVLRGKNKSNLMILTRKK